MPVAIPLAIVAAGAISAAASSSASKSAAGAQAQGAQNATDETARQYNTTRADQAPYRLIGGDALGRLSNVSNGRMADFTASPDYNFVRSEGQRGVMQSAAARGGAFSGNALKALTSYNQNLASGQFGDWWNRQAGLAGVGQSATNATGAMGAQAAGQIGNYQVAAGDARASGILGQANSLSGSINSGMQNYLAYRNGGYGNPYGSPNGMDYSGVNQNLSGSTGLNYNLNSGRAPF